MAEHRDEGSLDGQQQKVMVTITYFPNISFSDGA